MANNFDEIKKIIQEEVSKRKTSILLEEPGQTKVERPASKTVQTPSIGSQEPTKVSAPPQISKEPEQKQQKDLRPGFNLYHGILTQAFTEAQSMSGETASLIQKLSKVALEQLGDEETDSVFQSNRPKEITSIVQKAFLVALNHVAKVAEAESIDKDVYRVATKE